MNAKKLIAKRLVWAFLLPFLFINTGYSNDSALENCEEEDVVFQIYCPETAWITCGEELWDLEWLGNAYYHDYSGKHDAGEPIVKYYLNDCNIGYITRSWSVADYNNVWHKCSQKIYVQGNYFNYNSIKWPKNIELVGCNPGTKPEDLPYGKNRPTWSDQGATCSKIGYNYHDNVYVYGPGCYEIIRTWNVVDCCNFNPYYNTGIWSWNQRITVTSTGTTPSVWVPYSATGVTTNCEKVQVDIPPIEVKDGCEDQYIITNNSPYATKGGADASGKYPVGVTKVRFMVKYNCWETKFYYLDVKVTDNSTPVPYCYYGLAIPFMGIDTDDDGIIDDGMVEVWASDLNAGSYHPCRPNEKLRFSFSSDPNDNVRVFNCEDVGEKKLEIWVTDELGKQDYCGTYIKLQNNGANIPDCQPISDARISGSISSVFNNTTDLMLEVKSTYEGMVFDTSYMTQEVVSVIDSAVGSNGKLTYYYGIEEVNTAIYDTTHTNKDFELPVTEGTYQLDDLELNEDYVLILKNESNSLEFIDTLDVQFLEAYLNGQIEMTMYQKMASDLNHDQMIDISDLELLNKFVEGSIASSEIDLSWVTFDPNYKMTIPNNFDIGSYPVSKKVEIKNRNASGIDLVIFQMGDLTNESIQGKLYANDIVSLRNINAFKLESLAPNPFTNSTSFKITNDKLQDITLELYNINGSKILTKIATLDKGRQILTVESEELTNSGIYFYILKSKTGSSQGKLILIK